MRVQRRPIALAVASVLLVAACTTTKMVHTWSAPGFSKTSVKKVLVLGISTNPSLRRLYEDTFSVKLEKLGYKAVSGYLWAPDAAVWPLLEVIDASASQDWCRSLAAHLGYLTDVPDAAHRRGRRYAVARRVAGLFDAYATHRPDMLSAYAAHKASLANVRAAKAEFMPKVFVSATGSHNSGRLRITSLPGLGDQSPTMNVDTNRTGGVILAGVTVPLFDGGRRAAQLAQARAAADGAKARLAQVQDDAVKQIAVADNALRTSLESVSAADALVAAAQTTFDAALGAYRSGVGSIRLVGDRAADLGPPYFWQTGQ